MVGGQASMRIRNKRLRAEAKAKGLCIKCNSKKAMKGLTSCEVCREKYTEWQRKYRNKFLYKKRMERRKGL